MASIVCIRIPGAHGGAGSRAPVTRRELAQEFEPSAQSIRNWFGEAELA